jgi:predicted ATPase
MHREVRGRQHCSQPNVQLPKVFWPAWALQVLLSTYGQYVSGQTKALYLHGTSGVGKTFIVRKAFEAQGYSCKYLPLPGTFFMGTFDPSCYDHTVFEEFDYDLFRSKLLTN